MRYQRDGFSLSRSLARSASCGPGPTRSRRKVSTMEERTSRDRTGAVMGVSVPPSARSRSAPAQATRSCNWTARASSVDPLLHCRDRAPVADLYRQLLDEWPQGLVQLDHVAYQLFLDLRPLRLRGSIAAENYFSYSAGTAVREFLPLKFTPKRRFDFLPVLL